MKPILEIKNISKKYKLRGQESPYLTFRDALMSGFKGNKTKDEFWALDNISFDVYPGESIGIIGRNGAGKSTLLKILSRITPPTKGEIICRGRIASLLEVGTGFHAELTGRENIFLNGSILGLRKEEIKAKFDEIVDFSGVEKFLDTPLKHYSSGMQLRLAFAVAAHLEPEILIIDEVLAVGDIAFQRKCINKMDEVGRSGRTILFVSHNLAQVQSLCTRGVFLDQGNSMYQGNIDDTITAYLKSNKGSCEEGGLINLQRLPRSGPKNNNFEFISLRILNEDQIHEEEPIEFELIFVNQIPIKDLIIGFSITNMLNLVLIEARSTASFKNLNIKNTGENRIKCSFNANLKAGLYNFNLGARSSNGFLEYIPSITSIEIIPAKNTNKSNEWDKPSNGLYIMNSDWSIEK